ncbi:MAG: RsmB/NOP family class I SAM-dependent RNA methyltransferase [Pseudomonadota bacterium]
MVSRDETAEAPGLGSRKAALDLIDGVTIEGRLLSELTGDVLAPLAAPERARAGRLATETLRWAGRADRVLGPCLRQKPPLPVLNALRLAIVELFVFEEAAHGVVSSAVSLARSRTGEDGLARLTNGVLRRILREAPDWQEVPIPSLPKPLRKPLVAAYGRARVEAIEAVHAAVPPLDLTPRDDTEGLARRLDGVVLPTGSVRIGAETQVSALPGFDDGAWWVQDAASALPAQLLGAKPGERVLDLCAAPGGKTLQLAAMGAEVTALDISARRMARVEENLARIGLRAECVVGDGLVWDAEQPFDGVLLDAPCSATGTIRRHPDLPHAKRDLDLTPLLALQGALIDRAVALTRPAGRIIYCTCSLFPEEGEAQVAAAMERHECLTIDPIGASELPGLDPAWLSEGGTLRITPESWAERGGIDGFFIARLARR